MKYLDYLKQIPPFLLRYVVPLLLGLGVIYGLVLLIAKILKIKRLMFQPYAIIEITPPAFTDKTPAATQQLFNVLHGLTTNGNPFGGLFRNYPIFTLEVVSTRSDGILFHIRVPASEAGLTQQYITSYLPDVKVKLIEDKIPAKQRSEIIEFRQKKHFAYPLNSQASLEQHDAIGYLMGSMSKLKDGEVITFQIVASPVHLKEADELSVRLMNNEDIIGRLNNKRNIGVVIFGILTRALSNLGMMVVEGIGDAHHGHSPQRVQSASRSLENQLQIAQRLKPARQLSNQEQDLFEQMQTKLSQPLFMVNIRASLTISDSTERRARLKSIKASLLPLAMPRYQALLARNRHPIILKQLYRRALFSLRLPAMRKRRQIILSASELGSLFHFPHSGSTHTENIVKSLSRTLPAPLSLKASPNLDIVLGQNTHHGNNTPIGLTKADRERHVYIIGGTGNGKTTLIQYAIIQDIAAGRGLAIVDPHGDLAKTILKHIPEERIKDVIYFNPDDLGYPVSLNLLELPESLGGDDLLREKDMLTESIISVFRKIFSDEDSGGHRVEYILRNSIHTALTIKDANIFTIFRLLTDGDYRKTITNRLEDEDLKNFWKNELGKAGEFQRVKMSAGITSKVGRFLFSATARRVMEQPKSSINFDTILDDGKILICNFAKGNLGEDTSELFGITILAKLQLAALKRARQEQEERRPFYIYVDEFQNFATMSFVQMLSEARKYQVFLTMAEQSTSQQEEQRLVHIILANVGTVICFRTSNPADEQLLLPLFSPYVDAGEISNLPSFNFYMRISTLTPQEPFSGETLLLPSGGDPEVASRVIAASRSNYARAYKPKATKPKPIPKNKVTENEEDPRD
jgi:hypothetical protein